MPLSNTAQSLSHSSPNSAQISARPTAAFFGQPHSIQRVWAQNRRAQLESELQNAGYRVFPTTIDTRNFEQYRAELHDLQLIFATWGMPGLNEAQIAEMPNLRAIFYAAGSVQGFARPFLARGIHLTSAWAANAVPVAEWTLAQILLSNKGFWRNVQQCATPEGRSNSPHRGRGNFGASVAILGMGQIGRRVRELLRPFALKVIVFDPFLSAEDAAKLQVERVTLEEAFARGDVVTNHIANLPTTIALLRGVHFAQMPPDATFINTGRGATVAQNELLQVLAARPDLTALLDVTQPEPPEATSLLYQLPNVRLTSHLAGSQADECVRMADYAIEDWRRFERGETSPHAVSLPMLETMA